MTITNCTFTGNTAGHGGAVFNNGSVTLVNCTLSGNTATGSAADEGWGGGMFNTGGYSTITNCTLSGNQAGTGGGIYNDGSAYPTVTNCILWGNTATSGSGGGVFDGFQSSATLSNTDSQDFSNTAPDPTSGNFGADPLFVRNPFTNGPTDYGFPFLQAGSPCIDAGDDAAVTVPPFPDDGNNNPVDRDGDPRIAGRAVDLGSHETPAPVTNRAPLADAGQDREVLVSHDGDPNTNTAAFTLDGTASSDPDGDSLAYEWKDAQGDVLGTSPTLNLSRSAGSSYTVTLTVTDPGGETSTDTVQVTVTAEANGAPGANDQTLSLNQDGSKSITLSGSDPDRDTITYSVATRPAHGTLTGTAPNLTYTPNAGYIGPDSFTFTVTDSYGAVSNPATVSLTVNAVDATAPVITTSGDLSATATSTRGAAVTFSVTANDNVDGSVPVTCTPPSGSLFAPGKTTVSCTATDAAGNQATKTFVVWVQYAWSGYLSPLPKQSVNRGSTIPVKFALTGASTPITNLSAKLYVTAPGSTTETLLGTLRYDATTKQYVYNWSTKGLTAGTYRLSVDLGDGVTTRTVTVGLK